ncbi:response regulator [Fulvivirga sp. M361]|nr:response regulator [Fulvivirga sp. M361]
MEDFEEAVTWLVSMQHSGREIPGVIICDSKINEKSTLTEIRQLKELNACSQSKIIFLTKQYDEAEMHEAIKAGANDYFSSDLNCSDLLMRVNFLIKLGELSNSEVEEDEIINENLKPKFWRLKRTVDIVISSISLLMLSPVLILIAIAIKLDSKGAVFYISKRAGKGYQIFNFYKFRTMREDADTLVQNMKHLNQYGGDDENTDSVFFKVKDDPRITKLGSFLRKTSLDEIPQLFNVLKGDMSLVGNRPLPLYEAEKLTQDQWAMRFLAPAGITGLWQVSKRGKDEMSEEERVSLDMEYAEKSSFWYDMKIMLKTPTALLQKEQV